MTNTTFLVEGRVVKIKNSMKRYYPKLADTKLQVARVEKPWSSYVSVRLPGKKVDWLKKTKRIYRSDLSPAFDGDLSKYA